MFHQLYILCLMSLSFGENLAYNLDTTFDAFVKTTDERLKASDLDSLPLLNLSANIQKMFMNMHLECQDGTMRSAGSLKKVGNVLLTKTENASVITVPMIFETLEFVFEKCSILHVPSALTNLHVRAKSNDLIVQIAITKEGNKCKALLSEIKFHIKQELNVEAEGELLNILRPVLNDPFLEYMNNEVVRKVFELLYIVFPLYLTNEFHCDTV